MSKPVTIKTAADQHAGAHQATRQKAEDKIQVDLEINSPASKDKTEVAKKLDDAVNDQNAGLDPRHANAKRGGADKQNPKNKVEVDMTSAGKDKVKIARNLEDSVSRADPASQHVLHSRMSANQLYFNLSKSGQIPALGLGTWQAGPGEAGRAVREAIRVGYRHFDCASVYQNENEVGQALKEAFEEGKVTREEVFLTSKVWNTFHTEDRVRIGVEASLKALGVSYLDLCLIHWPYAFQQGDDLFPKDQNGGIIYDTSIGFTETWRGLEKCLEAGLVRHIGVSNFNQSQVQEILDKAKYRPEVLQVESHPYLTQGKLIEFCRLHGILVVAYSPLGSPGQPGALNSAVAPRLLSDPTVKQIAEKYKKTSAQVLIRFHLDRGVATVPKTVRADRISENFNVFDFKLSTEEVKLLEGLNKPLRYNPQLRDRDDPRFPFKEDH